jgi:hypothetical protein
MRHQAHSGAPEQSLPIAEVKTNIKEAKTATHIPNLKFFISFLHEKISGCKLGHQEVKWDSFSVPPHQLFARGI